MKRAARSRRARWSAVGLLAVVGGSLPTTPAAGEAAPAVAVVGPLREQPVELPADVADAVDAARTLTEQHPADFGYAWVDATNTVVIPAATPAGRLKAARFVPPKAAAVPRVVASARFSRAHLDRIKDEAIELTSADVPDGELIYQTEPDAEHNRVLVTVERHSEALVRALARRYGTDAIAVRVDPDRPSPQGRQADIPPYYGGARIAHQNGGTCSSGFSWVTSDYSVMITAGHCAPSGGWIYAGTATSANYMGTVWSGYRESWTNGVGTVLMTGQTAYRGDLAYVRFDTGKTAAARIYRGGPTSSTSAVVRELWHRRPVIGDRYCVGGATAGELCGWGVASIEAAHRYTNGETVRPAVTGMMYGSCTRPGDSGGPVYTVRTDGAVSARGIHSGGNDAGGDYYGNCTEVFTDMWEADAAFPGTLHVG